MFRVVVIALTLAVASSARAEQFKLGRGVYAEHPRNCGLATFEWLQKIVDHHPILTCRHFYFVWWEMDWMDIQAGSAEPVPATDVDGSTGHWVLDDEHTLIISINPLARPVHVGLTIGLLHHTEERTCWEKWSGEGVHMGVAVNRAYPVDSQGTP